jgi:hypothetical protein
VEGADRFGRQQEISPIARRLRVGAAVVVLLVLAVIGAMLIPPYFENMRFQRYLDEAVTTRRSPDMLRAVIVNKAGQLGLPVREGDIRIIPARNGVHVEIIYVIRVDLPLYTVDLHFHPSASS